MFGPINAKNQTSASLNILLPKQRGIDLSIDENVFCGEWNPRCPIPDEIRPQICNSMNCSDQIFEKLPSLSIIEPIEGFHSCQAIYVNCIHKIYKGEVTLCFIEVSNDFSRCGYQYYF